MAGDEKDKSADIISDCDLDEVQGGLRYVDLSSRLAGLKPGFELPDANTADTTFVKDLTVEADLTPDDLKTTLK